MRLDEFIDKFDVFADTPDAPGRLRDLVLQLAMRGKLVEQLPSEGDADSLLEAIAERRGWNAPGATNEDDGAEASLFVDGWHAVPRSWRWVPLKALGAIVGGGTPPSETAAYFADEGIPWLTPADLNGFKGKRILRGRRCITEAGLEASSARLLPPGSVLFSSRAPIGYVAIAGTELATNQGFKSCVPFVGDTTEFLYYYLKSVAARVDREASGTTFREVSGKIVGQIPVPVPPVSEQKRIVAKLDALMDLCDRLEAQQRERDTRYTSLARASLAQFTDEPTPAALELLFHSSYSMPPSDLRRAILALAVRGRLVPRNPADEPPRISFPKLASAAVDSAAVGIPAHWLQVPLGQCGEWRGGGTPSKSHTAFWEGDIPWVSPKDMKTLWISDAQDHISDAAVQGSAVRMIPGGSLLMVVRGMILARAFPVAMTMREVTINQDMKALLPFEPDMTEYLLVALRAIEGEVLASVERSSHGTCKLKTDVVHGLTIPIPPLAEQRRIVAKVEQLMALVDDLESDVVASRSSGVNVMEAVVAELTVGA